MKVKWSHSHHFRDYFLNERKKQLKSKDWKKTHFQSRKSEKNINAVF